MLRVTSALLSRGTIPKAAMLGNRLKKDVVRDFLDSAYRVWGSRFDYSISEYKHPNVPVKLVCKQHGAFSVTPREHLHMHKGCPNCRVARTARKKVTQAALPPSPDLKEFMKQLSPGLGDKHLIDKE